MVGRLRGCVALAGVAAVLALVVAPGGAQASGTFTVSNTSDSGTGSLRAAIAAADAAGGGTIDFSVAGEIQPLTALPSITAPVIIDGTSAPGYSGTPVIQLDGSMMPAKSTADALLITAGPSAVDGLEITDWKGAGIELQEGKSKTTPGNGSAIEADYIGTNGSTALPDGNGVLVDGGSSGNTIGGSSSSDLDVISGNRYDGVQVEGGSGNTVEGDLIGTDSMGTAGLGNGDAGVLLGDKATGDTIGGATSGEGDVIAANNQSSTVYDQVDIGDAGGNTVEGDYLGPDASGSSAPANEANGVYIYDGADNTIGGSASGEGNVISGNKYDGVQLWGSSTSGNTVDGNYIGTDAAGTGALGNDDAGVFLGGGAKDNTVGGTTSGARNVISANNAGDTDYAGIDIDKAINNTVEGNYVGTDDTGATALANNYDGIDIYGGSTGNTVGGTSGNDLNVISGNDGDGVWIGDSGASKNFVEGDDIGTDDTATKTLANKADGVQIADSATSNTIGGTASGAGDVLSGNGEGGVEIDDKGTSKNVVEGDYIGTNPSNSTSIGNADGGVGIFNGATANTIGGTTAAARNVISGNDPGGASETAGVLIDGTGTSNNVVEGDYIGTNVAGNSALANGYDGVAIVEGASANTVGGTASGAGNVLSGNAYRGVEVDDASKNVVEGDLIGTDETGTAAVGNLHDGVFILDGSTANVIGGSAKGAGNIIAANGASGQHEGVELSGGGTTKNVVQGDYIGTNASGATGLGNTDDGVLADSGASGNTIGGTTKGDANTIDYNDHNGVQIDGSSTTGDPIETNSIFDNTHLAIALTSGGNDDQPSPTVTGAISSGSGKTAKTTITGTVPASKDSLRIEVFTSPSCPSSPAPGQGQIFLGATSASKGAWKLTVATSALDGDSDYAATSTDTKTLDTSEFSPCLPIE